MDRAADAVGKSAGRWTGATAWSVALLGAWLAAIFLLPYHVPLRAASSEAYTFGFSNRVAVLLTYGMFATVAGLAWTGLLGRPHWMLSAAGAGRRDTTLTPTTGMLALTMAVTLVSCLVVAIPIHESRGLAESTYLLDRIGLLDHGLRPYHDFEFAYGPLLLYGPFAMARLLRVPMVDGYLIVWAASSLIGMAMFWASVRMLIDWSGTEGRWGTGVFLALGATLVGTIPSTGLNYTPLRYAAPMFLLLATERLDRWSVGWRDRGTIGVPVWSPVWGPIGAAALSAGVAGASAALLLGLSPETGITFAVAVCLFLPARRYVRGEPAGVFTAMLLALLGGVLAAGQAFGVFSTMKAFADGALNLPVLPGPQVLLFFVSATTVLLFLFGRVEAGPVSPALGPRGTGTGGSGDVERGRWSPLGTPIALLMLYSLGMIPGALGRWDWIHVVGYELGLLLPAALVVWSRPPLRVVALLWLLAPWLWIEIGLLEGLAGQWLKADLYRIYRPRGGAVSRGPQNGLEWAEVRAAERSLTQALGPETAARKMERIRTVAAMPDDGVHALFPGATAEVYAPFLYLPERFAPEQSQGVVEGRFSGLLNLLTSEQVRQKVDEMREHPERDVVLAPEDEGECSPLVGNMAALRSVMMSPFVPRPRNVYDLLSPICGFVHTHYVEVVPATAATAGYELWRFEGPHGAKPADTP